MVARHRQEAIAFPEEVWQLIASYMSMSEWAQVAGTCKTTWNLQLDKIQLTLLENAEGAPWILKRGRKARRLELGQLGSVEQVDAAAAAILLADNSWGSLRALKVVSKNTLPECSTASFHSAVTWLLGGAKGLTFLRLHIGNLQFLPHLAQLKHLQLTIEDGLGRAALGLGSLMNLQTLFLDQDLGLDQEECHPDLLLDGLRHLRSVSLYDVVPASLTLPPGAALHLRMCSMENARDSIWNDFASNLQSVHIRDDDGDDGFITEAAQLPGFLTGPSGLESIILRLGSLGKEESPMCLSGSFLQVECLVVQCNADLRVSIPRGLLPWHLAKFVCGGTLELIFGSTGDFLDSCPAFSFGYRNLQGLDLMRLCQSMGARGIQTESVIYLSEGYEFHSLITPYPYNGYFINHSCEKMCNCGACPSCSDMGSCGSEAQFPSREF